MTTMSSRQIVQGKLLGCLRDAVSFAVDRLCEQGLDGAERDAAAKTLTGGFRRWATSHLVRRFWPTQNEIDAQAVAEDAVQHLICAVLQGKARCLRGKNADEVGAVGARASCTTTRSSASCVAIGRRTPTCWPSSPWRQGACSAWKAWTSWRSSSPRSGRSSSPSPGGVMWPRSTHS